MITEIQLLALASSPLSGVLCILLYITVTNDTKTVFSVILANREPDQIFFSLKPSGDQGEDNALSFSSICVAVFEFLDDRQSNIMLLYIRD